MRDRFQNRLPMAFRLGLSRGLLVLWARGKRQPLAVDGNKLTIAFDKAGKKRVVDSFAERV